jgi:hypothetical protein
MFHLGILFKINSYIPLSIKLLTVIVDSFTANASVSVSIVYYLYMYKNQAFIIKEYN